MDRVALMAFIDLQGRWTRAVVCGALLGLRELRHLGPGSTAEAAQRANALDIVNKSLLYIDATQQTTVEGLRAEGVPCMFKLRSLSVQSSHPSPDI